MNGPKNIAASVKARLQNVASKRGDDFNLSSCATASNACPSA